MITCIFPLHQLNPPLETRLGFFSARPSFLLAGFSIWPKRSKSTKNVAACGTAFRSATERNEMGGYITVSCSSKMTQRSSTADWLKF